jgi:hypothetical protein
VSVVRRVEPDPERLLVRIVAEGVADYFFAKAARREPVHACLER